MTARLPTELWVSATLRQCAAGNIPVYVTRRGAAESGTIVVKVVMRNTGCRVFTQGRDMDGNPGWIDVFDAATVDETRADQYIQRTAERDPDVWVVEVEDMSGQNPFEGKII